MTEKPRTRVYWIPQVANPAAPTADEIAAGVPLDGWEMLDDGLQFTRDESVDLLSDLFPQTRRYKVIHHSDGSMDVIRVHTYSIELVSEPDWIVLRAADDLPSGLMPAALDGMWVDRPQSTPTPPEDGVPFAVFTPTGRFETRDDGAVAEVWEMRP